MTLCINVVGRVFAQAYDTVAVNLILHATTGRRRHVRSLRVDDLRSLKLQRVLPSGAPD